ncbi:MAG: response regulator transcription factor [Chloracidobacterium sp.]|uniref:Response regulator transcription factor n=1 Tax=Chloracidobacterium validum TaxID=2821543 RepID=A0ABX8B5E1_9BACT|nr:response regulator transcription factor [Chloracidobacterium validum]QUW02148.1 response regulator transcription factor [Chloracidobacterium validum]
MNEAPTTEHSKPTILVVDDDPTIRLTVGAYLTGQNFTVLEAATAREALEMVSRQRPQVIVLDVVMPDLDGLQVCRQIRECGVQSPILFLSTDNQLETRLKGFASGGDDYLTKPFNMLELGARIQAILRRHAYVPEFEDILVRGDLSIDVIRRRVIRHGNPVELTPTEFRILLTMARRPGQVFSRDRLLDELQDEEGYLRNVDPHIARLRAKIEPTPSRPMYVQTVWGQGYKFEYPNM